MARKLAVSPFVLHQSMPCFFLWLSLVGNYWHHWRWLCTGPPHSEMTSRINLWRWWCNQAEILAIPQNQIFNTLWFCLTFTYKTLPSMWCVFFVVVLLWTVFFCCPDFSLVLIPVWRHPGTIPGTISQSHRSIIAFESGNAPSRSIIRSHDSR